MVTRKTVNELLSPDETLVDLTRDGCDAAFAALMTRYGDSVYGIVRNMCATAREADELTQQTFVSAYREIASLPADSAFSTWLFRTAVKTSLVERRPMRVTAARMPQRSMTAGNEDRLPISLPQKWPDLTDPALEPGNFTVPLREALERMDDGVRAAFVLRDLAELPPRETAAILQISSRKIGLRVHRARLMLISVIATCFQARKKNGLHR